MRSAEIRGVGIASYLRMKNLLKILILSSAVLLPGSTANAQVSFGIRIGEPPAPRWYRVPAQPAADYEWVEGYWYPDHGRWRWHDGYWTRAPYEGAYWIAPYWSGGQYFSGRWEGGRGYFNHEHRWDRSRQRDENRWRGRDERHDRGSN